MKLKQKFQLVRAKLQFHEGNVEATERDSETVFIYVFQFYNSNVADCIYRWNWKK